MPPGQRADILFDAAVWRPALEKYGAVVHLSVGLFGPDAQIVFRPVPSTPFVALFEKHGRPPGLCAEAARACLAQPADDRHPIVVGMSSGLAVVGVSLLLEGKITGALVAGYALLNFCDSVAIARLARETGVAFEELWAVARSQAPAPARRLVQDGELLQLVGDTLLGENSLRRRSEDTAVLLTRAAAVKEGFLAVLSHELRTPLTPILGWASILKQQSDPKVVHAAAVIERNAMFQLRMVEDLLELTRSMRGTLALDLAPVCLNDQVRAAAAAIADGAVTKQIETQFSEAPEMLWIKGDGDRLQQILRNVLDNAVKFTAAGGAITMTLTTEGDAAIVRVSDTGEGIAPEFLPSVFEMFQQQEQGTRRTHPGLGIGLALVKQLTEAQGGTVSVASEGAGHGTQVTLTWPVITAPGSRPEPLPNAAEAVLNGLRVLIVEDMDDSREAMCMMLEGFGASVVSASDGVEALERAVANSVDLILCDIRMPRMDGFEFLHELKGVQGDAHPPVIAVSGLASSADHLATQAAGFIGHIDKPFDDGRLLAAVDLAMGARLIPAKRNSQRGARL